MFKPLITAVLALASLTASAALDPKEWLHFASTDEMNFYVERESGAIRKIKDGDHLVFARLRTVDKRDQEQTDFSAVVLYSQCATGRGIVVQREDGDAEDGSDDLRTEFNLKTHRVIDDLARLICEYGNRRVPQLRT